MALKLLPSIPILSLLLLLLISRHPNANTEAEVHRRPTLHRTNETLEWQLPAHHHLEPEFIEEVVEGEDEEEALQRRSLYWRRSRARRRYYISYGALSANRIPCPPRSGRSYYTHNCHRARGPVHPYTRGCSAISRCRR